MSEQTGARMLYEQIHYAKVNGLFSVHDARRHYGIILQRLARRTHASPLGLENAFRAAYGLDPMDFIGV